MAYILFFFSKMKWIICKSRGYISSCIKAYEIDKSIKLHKVNNITQI
jgi:hypothetical protein